MENSKEIVLLQEKINWIDSNCQHYTEQGQSFGKQLAQIGHNARPHEKDAIEIKIQFSDSMAELLSYRKSDANLFLRCYQNPNDDSLKTYVSTIRSDAKSSDIMNMLVNLREALRPEHIFQKQAIVDSIMELKSVTSEENYLLN